MGWREWALQVLVEAERVIFCVVGAMFFIAAFALAAHAAGDLWALVVGPKSNIIYAGTAFLDVMLLVLMLVELAYTLIASLRGADLSAEPFLIVGLIAVIRRVLVITIGSSGLNHGQGATPPTGQAGEATAGLTSQPLELAVLTGVVLVFVVSIAVLRSRPPRTPPPSVE
ncbi:MAG TPA: phosphate-starvation-inducible PsiE family protein [Candidatus Acidoferrales bacterium]|nr:phosphate-starvation-inducible PsiE family protein [Candidatus Acidoferrales bacterium]